MRPPLLQITPFIAKKRDGGEHSADELRAWLDAYLNGDVKDYHMAAWLMAVFFRGMTPVETVEWTRLMWKSGRSFPRASRNDYWVDKHSTGGVGDKPSLILVPLVASVCQRLFGAGKVRIPMVSGRGLGHSGGTLDKLESVRGFSTALTMEKALELIEKNDFVMMGQTVDLAPADRMLYALRDVTGTVESRPLIVSSILSKKFSESLDGLVMDVKVGAGAFMKTESDARKLAEGLLAVSGAEGVDAVALFTRMDEPLGYKVGNHLEVEECADFLTGKSREPGLYEVTLELAAWMVSLGSRKRISPEDARAECEKELALPGPFALYKRMFAAQGGSWETFEKDGAALRRDLLVFEWKAKSDGRVREIKALPMGLLLNFLGGGRHTKEEGIDARVGIEFLKKSGNAVKAGESVVRVYHRRPEEAAQIQAIVDNAVVIGSEVGGAPPKSLIVGVMS